jgi:phospholipid/cholesterol/gamma-HCH transport system substrate-binding protein
MPARTAEGPGIGTVARVAAIGAAIAAIVLVALVLFTGGGGYQVRAQFENAGQLVKGNLVQVGGAKAGTVEDFTILPNGLIEATLAIDDRFAPLEEGTRAVIRQGSQSSVASKYVDLHMPPEDGSDAELEEGGVIGVDNTMTSVEFDQFLSIFDDRTRRSLRGFFKGQNRQYYARGDEGNAGLRYLNSSLSATSRLFRELSYDPPVLERFLVDTSRFVTALSDRRDDLSALVSNLNRTTGALAAEKDALAEVVSRFPGFMRSANTTFVNLRSTLDDVEPFVEASKPVAKRLRPYLGQLRPFARDAVPTVRDLSRTIRRPGELNDLVELNRTYPALAQIALETRVRNGERRRGAFPELTEALRKSAPTIAHGRPYAVDFLGWFDDFSHTGAGDAVGSFSRSQTYFNAFTPQLPPGVPCPSAARIGGGCLLADLSESLGFDTSNLRGEVFKTFARTEQFKRCPGAAEEAAPDGSNVFSEEEQKELDCREEDRATGDIE